MKIIVTGSLGHISKPLTEALVKQGNEVVVISSKADKQKDIELTGAKAAIGSINNIDFLTATFNNADAAYCMIPPNFSVPDQIDYYKNTGKNYATAIQQSGIKRVVDLSSYGSHLEKGTGFIAGSHHVESMLNELEDVAVTHMRPGYFYYNLFHVIPMIKQAGFIGNNYGDDDRLILVAPQDIATAIADEITTPSTGKKIRYVASDERSCNEIAKVLGQAIGKPGLEWKTLSSEQVLTSLEANGYSKKLALTFVELGEATHKGLLREEYDLHPPVLGKVKLEDFAKEFAAAYNSNNSNHY